MKKNNILYLIYTLITLGCMVACDAPQPEEGGVRIAQMAQLNNYKEGKATVASASRATVISIKDEKQLSQSIDMTISLYKPATSDITARSCIGRGRKGIPNE